MARQFESARSKRIESDALPTKAPMKQGPTGQAPKISRTPSNDERKVRRAMQSKTAELTVIDFVPRTASIASRPGYRAGYEAGSSFADSFISSDPVHPWNAMPHLRTRMSASYMPMGLRVEASGAFIAGFAQGVHDAQDEKKTATVLNTNADRLQPGDSVLGPTGQTLRVKRVRNHETKNTHVYVDTDQGTTLIERNHPFQISPHNTTQQEIPGFGIPGANTNSNPYGRSDERGGDNSMANPSGTCPNCGASGSMTRRGGTYVCSRCGYHEQTGPMGQGANLSDSERVIKTFTSLDRPSAIARRAHEALNPLEEK